MNEPNESIVETAESVFETMLGIEIEPADGSWTPNPDGVIGMVHLTGTWNGSVSIEASREQACEFAGAFLSVPPPDAVNGDVRDVMGELANMIGGNLKSTMAHGASLSPPLVVYGDEEDLTPQGAVERQAFAGDCGTFWVARAKRPDESPDSACPENPR